MEKLKILNSLRSNFLKINLKIKYPIIKKHIPRNNTCIAKSRSLTFTIVCVVKILNLKKKLKINNNLRNKYMLREGLEYSQKI